MRIFLRILLLGSSTLSLLLAIAFLSIWIRSHYVQDYCETNYKFRFPLDNGKVDCRTLRLTFDSTNGLLRISSLDASLGHYTIQQAETFRESEIVSWSHIKPHTEPLKWLRTGPEGRFNRLGFYFWHGAQPKQRIILMRVIGIAWWAPTILFFILPITTLTLMFLRRRRRTKNFCPNCGYDLRATPDCCPECGAAAPGISIPS